MCVPICAAPTPSVLRSPPLTLAPRSCLAAPMSSAERVTKVSVMSPEADFLCDPRTSFPKGPRPVCCHSSAHVARGLGYIVIACDKVHFKGSSMWDAQVRILPRKRTTPFSCVVGHRQDCADEGNTSAGLSGAASQGHGGSVPLGLPRGEG